MANTYKNIVITPNKGSSTDDPKIVFSGANTTVNTDITLRVYPTTNGTLSFEGTAGQLFSITNDLTGSIFSVNDVSGIPSIDVNANGTIQLAPFSGNVGIGTTTPSDKLQVFATSASVDFSSRVDSSTASHRPSFRFIHTGGSLTTPSPTDARLGLVSFLGVSSTGTLTNYAYFDSFLEGAPTAGSESSYIKFTTISSGTTAERLRIHSNGNIGIGTTSPTYTLDVVGTINAASVLVNGAPITGSGISLAEARKAISLRL